MQNPVENYKIFGPLTSKNRHIKCNRDSPRWRVCAIYIRYCGLWFVSKYEPNKQKRVRCIHCQARTKYFPNVLQTNHHLKSAYNNRYLLTTVVIKGVDSIRSPAIVFKRRSTEFCLYFRTAFRLFVFFLHSPHLF